MSDFDDEEYVSFDLDGAGKATRTPSDADADADADADDDLEDDLDDDDDEDDDDPEDATDDEVDFVIAAYREDGQLYVQPLATDLANDLEELIVQLRRLPGDAGSLGFVSLVEEVFVIVRVRGQHVQVLLSDGSAATDWPIARDVADLLGADVDEDDDEPLGDLQILADLGLSEFDLGVITDNLDLSSDQMLIEIADKININPQFRVLAEAAFGS
jgi:putative tRNA adenosine deaminase-associated protein